MFADVNHKTPNARKKFVGSEFGATIIEFSFSIVVLLAFLSLVIDSGFAYEKYGIVSEITDQIVRSKAAAMQDSTNKSDATFCGGFKSEIVEKIEAEVRAADPTIHLAPRNGEQDVSILLADTFDLNKDAIAGSETGTPLFLSVRQSMPIPCVFCFMFPKGFQVHVRSRAMIENVRFANCVDRMRADGPA